MAFHRGAASACEQLEAVIQPLGDLDGDVRKLLAAGDLKGAVAAARREKMIYLQEAALAKAAAGETSIEEIVRVTAPPKKAEAAA